MRHTTHLRETALVMVAVALSIVVVLVLLAARPVRAHERCTHGVSSIGPVLIEDGKVVGGDTTPNTEACLP